MAAASYYNPETTPAPRPYDPPDSSPIEMGAVPAPLRPHSQTSTPNPPSSPSPPAQHQQSIPQIKYDPTDDNPNIPPSPTYSAPEYSLTPEYSPMPEYSPSGNPFTDDAATSHRPSSSTHATVAYPSHTHHAPSAQDEHSTHPPTDAAEKPHEHFQHHPHARKTFEQFKRFIKLLLALSNVTSTLINAVITGIMLFVTITYYKTQDDTTGGDKGGGGERLWPEDTKVWPAWLLLIASLITLGISAATLAIYIKAKKGERGGGSWKLTVAKYVVHIAVWAFVSGIYKVEQGAEDIWGWSCSQKAQEADLVSGGEVGFGRLCGLQVCVLSSLMMRGWVVYGLFLVICGLGKWEWGKVYEWRTTGGGNLLVKQC